jgi:hypothetical protein
MSRRHSKIDSDSNQPTLFSIAPDQLPGSLDLETAVRCAVTEAIKRSPKKRLQVAEEMTALVGRPITERMIDAYCADSHEQHRFPLAWLPALCRVTGNFIAAEPVIRALGANIISAEQMKRLQFGEIALQREISARTFDQVYHQLLLNGGSGR